MAENFDPGFSLDVASEAKFRFHIINRLLANSRVERRVPVCARLERPIAGAKSEREFFRVLARAPVLAVGILFGRRFALARARPCRPFFPKIVPRQNLFEQIGVDFYL